MSKSSRRRLREKRQRRIAQAAVEEWATKESPEPIQWPWWSELTVRHTPILLLAPAVFFAIFVLHEAFRPPIFQATCEITGCSRAVMTAVGWLYVSFPIWWVVAGILLRKFLKPWQMLAGIAIAGGWMLAVIFPPDALVDEMGRDPWAEMASNGRALGGLSLLLVALTQAVLGLLVSAKKLRLSVSQVILVAALVGLTPPLIALA
ncbi:MAG TPA: hypothetical protein VFX61_19770 [Micromonosporaceae bacterium]|nr:hypothetical protein [Micromonosporaceae bacterium]